MTTQTRPRNARKLLGPRGGVRVAQGDDVAIILGCRHGYMERGEFVHTLATTGVGVFCRDCRMILTWEELAEYMGGE